MWQVRVARGEEDSLPSSWFNMFWMVQASEVWAYHGEWLDQVPPRFQVPKP